MYEEHPEFLAPDNPDAWLWRYVDIARFLSMMTARGLYLCRADLLGDPFEGTISRATVASYNDPRSPSSIPAFQGAIRRLREALRRNVAVSCWHIAECESSAMWAAYAAKGSGIAIRTTYSRMVKSLEQWPTANYIGRVCYVDYETSVIGTANMLSPFVHKRREFESERELRIVVSQLPTTVHNGQSVFDHSVSMPRGLVAPIDLATLIERVVLAPQTPEWQADALREVVRVLGYSISVDRSALDAEAILG